jgi:SAM-dependent methyltransferase
VDYERLYEYRFRGIDQSAREAAWVPIAAFVHERLGHPQTVLDPAAGRGEFINAIPAKERWAVDMTAYEAAGPGSEVRRLVGDVMEVELPDDHFDAVFVSNFLEHLHDQEAISAFLERMRSKLRPGRRIAVMGPNYRHAAREYWDFADHYVALTEHAVEEHLYAAGLEPTESIPRFLPYSFRERLPASPRLVSAYLRFPPAWRLLGKQFLVTAERRPDRPRG